MRSATFFGHRDFDYFPYCNKVRAVLENLIRDCGVTEFYSGFLGNFDRLCAQTVFELKGSYPAVKNFFVLSRLDPPNFVLPQYFDESIYLLEKRVPPKFAIWHTNREIVLKVDYVVSGVCRHYGGAFEACKFARQKKKVIFDIF